MYTVILNDKSRGEFRSKKAANAEYAKLKAAFGTEHWIDHEASAFGPNVIASCSRSDSKIAHIRIEKKP